MGRIKDAVKNYRASKSIAKTVEPPAVVGVISTVIIGVAKKIDVAIEPEVAVMIATGLYGLYVGIKNYVKNRKK